jgi:hypothetical protein
MTATTIREQEEDEGPRTGHRPGRNPEEPRNSTVCFMVTEQEKATIDALSHCIHLRRSAILTEIVTRFLTAAQSSSRGGAKRTSLLDFLEECQEQIGAKRRLFDSLSTGE